MARGNTTLPDMEMTKWFDTNYHYIVAELSPELTFTYASHKTVNGYKEAKELGIDMVPVLVGLVPYLLLSEPAKSVPKTFNLLSLLDSILPIYKEVISELKAAGATLVQLDEPSLVLGLEAYQLEAFSRAYSYLEEATEVKMLVETYFADIPIETYKGFLNISLRAMASRVVGYPLMGPKREMKFTLESFWDKKKSAADLEAVAKELRASIRKQMVDARVKYIPNYTFSYYDKVLDTTAMLGAVPPRYGWSGEEIGFDMYFSIARENATLPAMEMTKWFDTNYYYIVPELSPELTFTYASHKVVNGYKEAKELGIDVVHVLVGLVPYLLLSEPAKSVPKTFNLLPLLDSILPIYKEVISELKANGAALVQLD